MLLVLLSKTPPVRARAGTYSQCCNALNKVLQHFYFGSSSLFSQNHFLCSPWRAVKFPQHGKEHTFKIGISKIFNLLIVLLVLQIPTHCGEMHIPHRLLTHRQLFLPA